MSIEHFCHEPAATAALVTVEADRNDPQVVRRDATDCGAFPENALPSLPARTVENAIASPAGHPGNRLSPAQQTAIALLVAGRSTAGVAATLRLHRSTISRWRHQHPLFAAELARRQRDVYETASRRLQLLMIRSIGVVSDALRKPREREEAAWRVMHELRASRWATPQPVADVESQEWPDDSAIDAPALEQPRAAENAHQSQSVDVIGMAAPTV